MLFIVWKDWTAIEIARAEKKKKEKKKNPINIQNMRSIREIGNTFIFEP